MLKINSIVKEVPTEDFCKVFKTCGSFRTSGRKPFVVILEASWKTTWMAESQGLFYEMLGDLAVLLKDTLDIYYVVLDINDPLVIECSVTESPNLLCFDANGMVCRHSIGIIGYRPLKKFLMG